MRIFEDPSLMLIQALTDNRLMRDQNEVDRFIDALHKLETWQSTDHKPEHLEAVLYAFDDSTEHIPPMQHLVNFVADYDPDVLAKTLLRVTHLHMGRASWWIEHFYLGLLVRPGHLNILKREFRALPDKKKPVIETLLQRVLKWGQDDEEMYKDLETRIKDVLGDRAG